jgi:hypothetical protein
MRLTVMGQLASGLANEQTEGPKTAPAESLAPATEETLDAGEIGKQLERVAIALSGKKPRKPMPVPENVQAFDLQFILLPPDAPQFFH